MQEKVITEFSSDEFMEMVRFSVREEMQARQSIELDPYLQKLRLITANQVATLAEVSIQTVRNWEKDGLIVAKQIRKTERYLLTDILDLILRRRDARERF